MRTVVVALALVAASMGMAWARPQQEHQFNLGAFFPTESVSGVDLGTGVAFNYTHIDKGGWYGGLEVDFYRATASGYVWTGYGYAWASADADVTAFAALVGPAIRDKKGTAYAGAGIGFTEASVDLGYGYTVESDTKFAWEVVVGTMGTPLGLQVRYRDGGMPASTGVTAALNYSF